MDENQEKKYVYFLYRLGEKRSIKLSSDFPLITIKTFWPDINLYEINIDKKKLKKNESIKIQLVLENNKKSYNISVDISDNRQNIFIYDINFKFRDNESYFLINSSRNNFNLNNEKKYHLFKYICENENNNNERKMEDLIYYTLKILERNKDEVNFLSFFVSIFNDIKVNKIEEIFYLMDLFDINKISFFNEIDEKNIDQNKILKIISHLYSKVNDKEKKITEDKMIQYLLFILILIDLSKSRFIEFLFRNNLLKNYLFKILLDAKKNVYKRIIFPELKLPNYIIDEFILDVKNYQECIIIISYQKNFLEALDIINRFFEYMTGLIKVENNPKNIIKKIQFVNFIKPDENDDLNKIKELLELLFTKEIKSNINILEISPELLIKYFQFHERNINELVYLYQIIIIISLAKKDINLIEIESLVHEALDQNIKGKKIKNKNLLSFFETAPMNRIIFYKNILDNIDITKIDDKFMEKFKKINWCKILNISKIKLVQKICKLIPNIKYFGKLFYLFDFNTYIDKLLINIIKERFINLLEISSEEDRQNIIYDCSKFIYYLNANNCDLDLFINNYIYKFFPSILLMMYILIFVQIKNIKNLIKNC